MEMLTANQVVNVRETLEDFKFLIPRFNLIRENKFLLKKFCTRNRNPIWDISNTKYFFTGLGSERALNSRDTVEDHYIQRSKAIEIIFEKLNDNPGMSIEQFLKILKKYCSVVLITKEEHNEVTKYCKKNPEVFNYEAYLACGIKIDGLSKIILSES